MNDTGERFKKKLQTKRLKKEPKKGKKPKDIFEWFYFKMVQVSLS
jgi:hypothetical protein